MMDFWTFISDGWHLYLQFLPVVLGAYITVTILRFPDLTIDATWSIGGIVACIVAGRTSPILSLLAATLAGTMCGLLTSGFFVIGGRTKFLAGLGSYLILTAIGARLLGAKASLYLPRVKCGFGLDLTSTKPWLVYTLIDLLLFIAIVIWQRSKHGIRSRLVGEKPLAGRFFRFGVVTTFVLGLCLSNGIVGLGGGLWSMYLGQSSNVQGIGMIIVAFFALLIGSVLTRSLSAMFPRPFGWLRRETPLSALLGCLVYTAIAQTGGSITVWANKLWPSIGIRPTDKNILIGLAVALALYARRKKTEERSGVSTW